MGVALTVEELAVILDLEEMMVEVDGLVVEVMEGIGVEIVVTEC